MFVLLSVILVSAPHHTCANMEWSISRGTVGVASMKNLQTDDSLLLPLLMYCIEKTEHHSLYWQKNCATCAYTYVSCSAMETCAIKLQAHGVSADVNARDLLLCSYYNYWEERCHSVTLRSLLLHGWVAKPQETDLLQLCHPIRVPHSGSQNSLKWTILWQMSVKAAAWLGVWWQGERKYLKSKLRGVAQQFCS